MKRTALFILAGALAASNFPLAQAQTAQDALAGATLGANSAATARSQNSKAQSAVQGTPGATQQTTVDPTLGPMVMQSQDPVTNKAPPAQVTLVPRNPKSTTTQTPPTQIPVQNCIAAAKLAAQNGTSANCNSTGSGVQ